MPEKTLSETMKNDKVFAQWSGKVVFPETEEEIDLIFETEKNMPTGTFRMVQIKIPPPIQIKFRKFLKAGEYHDDEK